MQRKFSPLSVMISGSGHTIFVSAGLAFLLSGCVAAPKDKGVEVGMSQGDVLQIMGKPTRKSTYQCPENARNCPEIGQYDGYRISFSDGLIDSTQ